MDTPEHFRPMASALVSGLGRPVTLRDANGENPIEIKAIPRDSSDEGFSGPGDGGRVQKFASIAFATSDAPNAKAGWTVTDGSDVWRLGAPTYDGRGMSRADLHKD